MTVHDPRRRVMLNGVLAAGCALGAPLWLGCSADVDPEATAGTSDRLPAAPIPSTASSVMARLSQEEAHYQDEPHDDQQCANCLHFVAETSTCKVVEGEVSPAGWCMLWVRL